jgi:hypothetical protein
VHHGKDPPEGTAAEFYATRRRVCITLCSRRSLRFEKPADHGRDAVYQFLATVDPRLDGLRGDPHFEQLMERVKNGREDLEA